MDNIFALSQRDKLAKIRAIAKQKGVTDLSKLRPQILKLYAKLTTTSSLLEFNTSDNFSSGVATENLLKRDSVMFVNLFGLAIHKVPIFSGVSYPWNSQLTFYPDKNVFSDAAAAPGVVPEYQCLEALYNGNLSFKTSQSVRLEDHPCNVFRDVPVTQNGAAAYPSQSLNLVDLNVSFGMTGQVNNKFQVKMGDGADRNGITGGAESQNYAVLLLAGFEIVDAARSNIKFDD